MAHELSFIGSEHGDMAYVGETPWHGLGQSLPSGADIATWQEAAGMDWMIQEAPINYSVPSHVQGVPATRVQVPDKKALYRGDSFDHLAVVGSDFKLVQPAEVLEFFRDLVAQQGFTLETAGVLFGGRRFWALAKTGAETRLRGVDPVKGYLLLATACDGTMATTAQFTSVRVVCNNTLQMSLSASKGQSGAVKVRHRTEFKPAEVKRDLGLEVWAQFEAQAEQLISTPFDRRDKEAIKAFMVDVFAGDPSKELAEQPNKRAMLATFEALCSSPGADLPTARNTAWGMLNAVTNYVDFKRPVRGANASDNRFANGQFGTGAALKQKALDHLMALAA